MPKEYRRIYERVSAELSAQIRQGKFQIEDRLPAERELATLFDVSRPSIREAIIALEVDGLVEVRTGSGVYVVSNTPLNGITVDADMGMFELLEARRGIESEAAALAAVRGSKEQIQELDSLIKEMNKENVRDVERSEDADRRFHLLIAKMTCNSAIYKTVEMLWEARQESAQAQHFLKWARRSGIKPRQDEHFNIVEAIRSKNGEAARMAMTSHISRVIDAALDATEINEIEKTKAEVQKRRQFYIFDYVTPTRDKK